jgi:WD40 repeat protein
VSQALFSPDNKLILTAPFPGVWDVDSGKKVRGFHQGGGFIGFLPDGRTVLEKGQHQFSLRDVKTWKLLRKISTPNDLDIYSCSLSPDRKSVLLGCHTGEVKFLDLASGKLVRSFKMHQSWVGLVLFSPDGTKVLSADSNVFNSPAARQRANKREMGLKLWRFDTGEVLHCLPHIDGWSSSGVCFSANGKLVLVNRTNSKEWEAGKRFQLGGTRHPYIHVGLWETSSGKIIEEVPIGNGGLRGIGLSPDGKKVWLLGHDGVLHLYDRDRRKEQWAVKVFWRDPRPPGVKESPIFHGLAVLSPDGKRLVTAPASYLGTAHKAPDIVLKLWDTATGQLVRTLRGPEIGPFPKR